MHYYSIVGIRASIENNSIEKFGIFLFIQNEDQTTNE
jgi:hypothetical protein